MSNSSRDTAPTTEPDASSGSAETSETAQTPEAAEAPKPPEASGTPDSAGEAFLSGAPAARPSGLFGAETFSVAGILLLATTLLSTQLVGILNRWVLTRPLGDEVPPAAVQGELTGAGLFCGLAVVCAAVALLRGDTGTRPWARHLAAATVLVGILFVVVTVVTYLLVPRP